MKMLTVKNCKFVLFGIILVSIGACKQDVTNNKPLMKLEYPSTHKDTIVDDYHGTPITDPYRWLEDDHSEETKQWVESQNKVTFDYLSNIPFRDRIKSRLENLWNYEKLSTPFFKGNNKFYYKNDGLQNQSVLYQDLGEEQRVILDPNTFSKDGTSSLGGISFNKTGDLIAYQISEGGSDWKTIKVMDVQTLEVKEDKIEWVKFSGISWQGNGFYYSRYAKPSDEGKLSNKNEYHTVYYHELGKSQDDDKLIYVDKDHPQRNVYASTTKDESYLLLMASESTSGNNLFIKNLKQPNSKFTQVVEGFDSDYSLVGNHGSTIYFMTNHNAEKQELVKIDANNLSSINWEKVVPEQQDALKDATIAGNRFFLTYLHDASAMYKVYNMDGSFIKDLPLPGIGNTGGISGDKDKTEAYFSYTSFTTPTSIYKLNTESLQYELYRKPTVDFDSDQYETKQVWYESYDGTKVPMFLTYKKGLKLDGTNPTLLYGYGGFDISILPGFSIARLPILENGGIYAVANIRGGGEFGSAWHKAGTLGQKQNVFNDFQAAAEYLISEKYTNSTKLAIDGRSNGGLLVGACMTQRPDLYQVAFPGVGVLDMLRYHQFTIGWAWASDYGRSDDPEAFKYLLKYSPLHNVKETKYPSTMVITADHDDRVVPAHSFKFISELQAKHTGENPVLIRVDVSAGHGAGKPTSKQIEEATDMISFMFYNMDHSL